MIVTIFGSIVGTLLGIFVLSYLIGDNPLYRLALHIFLGTVLGYAVGIMVRDVLLGMALPGLLTSPTTMVIPLGLGLLLLLKGLPRQAFVGNTSMAYLVGVGTAVALAGALLGTLVPQTRATARALSRASLTSRTLGLIDGLMIIVGTICTLLAFTFTTSERSQGDLDWQRVVRGAARVGRLFLLVAFGVAFAGVLTASLSVFVGRTRAFLDLALRALGLGL